MKHEIKFIFSRSRNFKIIAVTKSFCGRPKFVIGNQSLFEKCLSYRAPLKFLTEV